MPDRETVVKGLYDIGGFIAERVEFEQARNYLRTIDYAIALLKEQEAVVRCTIDYALALLKEQEAVVRCKDCKHFDCYNVECEKNHNPKPPYNKWFCADGEQK